MRRRDFISSALLGGVAVVWAPTARAQQPAGKIPRIGFLLNVRSELVTALMEGLSDAGYVEGQNMLVETRFHGPMLDRVVQFASELVALKCDVIFAAGPYAIQAAMRATSTTPIVGIDLESDPVATGWVSSLSRPGGNFTGFFLDLPELGGKMIELLKEAVPTLASLAVLWDFNVGEVQFRATEAAARMAGATLLSLPVRRLEDFKEAFDTAVRERVHAVVVLSSPLIFGQRSEIADLALKASLPTISLFTVFPRSGGLMAYGPNFPVIFKRAATYIDRILKGAKAGDMPVERPSRFELVVNLKTARALGLDIPWFLQQRADEVIE
jgi:putative ABC transport system substrate-binding protein